MGVILHGSRSGRNWSYEEEFWATARYAASGANGLGWNATIGPNLVALHIDARHWGWNAREHSKDLLAVEFAQPTIEYPITDAQIDAFCWWFTQKVLPIWPDIPWVFPTHAELPAGQRDGKTDVFPDGTDLRLRIGLRLEEWIRGSKSG
jgi:hypothetical protein